MFCALSFLCLILRYFELFSTLGDLDFLKCWSFLTPFKNLAYRTTVTTVKCNKREWKHPRISLLLFTFQLLNSINDSLEFVECVGCLCLLPYNRFEFCDPKGRYAYFTIRSKVKLNWLINYFCSIFNVLIYFNVPGRIISLVPNSNCMLMEPVPYYHFEFSFPYNTWLRKPNLSKLLSNQCQAYWYKSEWMLLTSKNWERALGIFTPYFLKLRIHVNMVCWISLIF